MKKTIKINLDESTGRIGFAIQQEKGSSESVEEIIKFIGVLEHLKQLQLEKLKLKGSFVQ